MMVPYSMVFQIESFLTLGFAKDPTLWKEHLCPQGALEKWASEKRTTEPLINNEVGYTCIRCLHPTRLLISFQKQQFTHYVEIFKKDGFASPLNWYKAFVKKLTPKDDAGDCDSPGLFFTCLADSIHQRSRERIM